MTARIPLSIFGAIPRAGVTQPTSLGLRVIPGPIAIRHYATRLTSPSLLPSALASSSKLRLPFSSHTSPRISAPPSQVVVKRSILQLLGRARSFSSSPRALIRSTYFPKGSSGGGGGGGSPPPGWFRNLRRRIDRIPTMTIVYGIIGLNIGVFLLWQYAIQSYQRFRDPALYRFLTQNFVLNEANILAGRFWTLLTSAFSHSSGGHIFVNCLGLYFMAPAAAGLIGSSAFLGLYIAGGIFSSVTSLLWHRATGDGKWPGSEGASGAIYTTLAFYAALFPSTTFLLFFVVPMPAWALVGGIFAYDCYQAVFVPRSGTDSSGHVGGLIAGFAAAMMVRRRGLGQVWRGGPRWR